MNIYLRQFLLFVFLTVLLSSFVYSQEYYADILFDVHSDGIISMKGDSNYVLFQDSNYLNMLTQKQKGVWLFSLSTEEEFSDAIITVKLPPRAVITYLKVPQLSSIEDTNSGIHITSVVEDKPVLILIQYTIAPKTPFGLSLLYVYIIGGVMLLAGVYYLYVLYLQFKKKEQQQYAHLTTRQQEILRVIQRQGGLVTQATIEKLLQMPKSSLSRNIDSLVKKEMIEKKVTGMTNTLFIKK